MNVYSMSMSNILHIAAITMVTIVNPSEEGLITEMVYTVDHLHQKFCVCTLTSRSVTDVHFCGTCIA